MVFGKKKKPAFERQPEAEMEEEEIIEEEELEEDLEVPEPQPTRKVVRKPIQPVQEEPVDVLDWSVQEVPTATTPVIYNSKTKKAFSIYEAVAEILNRTQE